MCTTWFVNNPFSCDKPSPIPSNYNNKAQGPCFSLGLDIVQKGTFTFWQLYWGLGKEKGRSSPFIEHGFIHTIGFNARDRELYLREFAKSLVDRAYTWYTTLRPRSIKTWDEMMERFCEKYYFGEDKVTFQSLQMVRQRPREDPVLFIKKMFL